MVTVADNIVLYNAERVEFKSWQKKKKDQSCEVMDMFI